MSETVVCFFRTNERPHGAFSQWARAPFELRGTTYVSAEQCMMKAKAELFGDSVAEAAIMATQDPQEIKRLGRHVRGFIDTQWRARAVAVVVEANLAKFQQNAAMGDVLCATHPHILAEASPHDRIWGIGLSSQDPRARQREQWRGLNLLGEALMRVRETLREERERIPPTCM